jgi:hypothetical protein
MLCHRRTPQYQQHLDHNLFSMQRTLQLDLDRMLSLLTFAIATLQAHKPLKPVLMYFNGQKEYLTIFFFF